MFRQIRLLMKLQLVNVLGFNEARHAPEGKRAGKLLGVAGALLLLALIACAYVGMLCFAMAASGMAELAPPLLAMAVSLVIFFFTALRSGGVIFDLRSYDRLISMPLRPTAIVASRFGTMYLLDAAIALLVLLPGAVGCGLAVPQGARFYPAMLAGALVLPLIPLSLGVLVGALIYALSARMRRKNLAVIALSLALLVALVGGSLYLQNGGVDPAALGAMMGDLAGTIARAYPPAGWFARGVAGSLANYALLILASAALSALVAGGIGSRFGGICARLSERAARGGYRLGAQRKARAGWALYAREMRRYFASPVYVMNTLTGGVMALVIVVAMRFAARDMDFAEMGLGGAPLCALMALLMGLMFSIAPTTASAISMEGRAFWLLRSLPVSERQVYRAKIGVNLTVTLPFWLASEALICAWLKPEGAMAAAILLVPLGYVCFASTLGLLVNLHAPMLSWEAERQPVKQGKAMVLTMIAGFVCVILPGVAMALIDGAATAICLVLAAALFAGSALCYLGCLRVPIRERG